MISILFFHWLSRFQNFIFLFQGHIVWILRLNFVSRIKETREQLLIEFYWIFDLYFWGKQNGLIIFPNLVRNGWVNFIYGAYLIEDSLHAYVCIMVLCFHAGSACDSLMILDILLKNLKLTLKFACDLWKLNRLFKWIKGLF